jgi:hypothetical protein
MTRGVSSKRGEIRKSQSKGSFLMCDFAADAAAAEQLLVGRVLPSSASAS